MYQKPKHRRSTGRVSVVLPVHWQSADGEVTMLQTQNISSGGMLLRSPCFVPPDQRISLSFTLPGEARPLQATAQARFVGPCEEGFELGAQIVAMSPEDWQAWQSWCQRTSQSDATPEDASDNRASVRSTANILLVSSALSSEILQTLVVNGCRVNVARDNLDALGLLRQRQEFEIMICEVRRKDLDGRALCDLIKHDRALRDVHVILLAEKDSSRELLDGLEAGATYVVVRPFTEEFLLSLITLCQRG